MAWNNDDNIDAEELGSIAKLVSPTTTPLDLVLSITMDGNAIQGEVPGKYGINTLGVLGYHFKFQRKQSDNTMGCCPLWVGRDVDAASAAISSAMKACSGKSKKSLNVELRAFKAGGGERTFRAPGDSLALEKQRPVLLIRLEEALIGIQAFQSNGFNGNPMEIIAFSYRGMVIETSPQLSSGITGATRTCDLRL
jgi:hypothetical protein